MSFRTTPERNQTPTRVGRIVKAKIPFDPSDTRKRKRTPSKCFTEENTSNDVQRTPKKSKPEKIVAKSKPDEIVAKFSETIKIAKNCIICGEQTAMGDSMKCVGDSCPAYVHSLCYRNENLYVTPGEELSWECGDCESCYVCKETAINFVLYKCYICLGSYHKKCHDETGKTKMIVVATNRFRCNECAILDKSVKETQNNSSDMINSVATAAVASSSRNLRERGKTKKMISPIVKPQIIRNQHRRKCVGPSNGYVSDYVNAMNDAAAIGPDVREWSYEAVYAYFKQQFPNEATVFRRNQIDGQALMLLERADILKGLGFLFGPALKINQIIVKMQTRPKGKFLNNTF